MEIDVDAIDPATGSEEENVVAHNDEGEPIPPGEPHASSLGHPSNFRDGVFEYHDPMRGPMSPMFYEPIEFVPDDRLLDIYRFEAKRAMASDSEDSKSARTRDHLEPYLEDRDLALEDVNAGLSQWYAAELPRSKVKEVDDVIQGFFAFAEGLEEVRIGETTSEEYAAQRMRVRFCEYDMETVTELTDADPTPISGPNAFE